MNEITKNEPLTVAAVQMSSQQDIEANLADIKAAISEASKQGAQLIVLPENCCSMGRSLPLPSVLMNYPTQWPSMHVLLVFIY